MSAATSSPIVRVPCAGPRFYERHMLELLHFKLVVANLVLVAEAGRFETPAIAEAEHVLRRVLAAGGEHAALLARIVFKWCATPLDPRTPVEAAAWMLPEGSIVALRLMFRELADALQAILREPEAWALPGDSNVDAAPSPVPAPLSMDDAIRKLRLQEDTCRRALTMFTVGSQPSLADFLR
jgi:hypothetical protein